MIPAGNLTNRIGIYNCSTIQTDRGALERSYENVLNLWAEVIQKNKEIEVAGKIISNSEYEIKCRYSPLITSTSRILIAGEYVAISSIVDNGDYTLTIIANSIANNAGGGS